MTSPKQIAQDFVVLTPQKKAFVEVADGSLYERIDSAYNGFKGHELISCYEFETDWGRWEVHPHGDEIVVLISGDVTFVLQTEAGHTDVTLKEQGQYLIVPQGVWHTARTTVKSKVFFITPGQGTEHKSTE